MHLSWKNPTRVHTFLKWRLLGNHWCYKNINNSALKMLNTNTCFLYFPLSATVSELCTHFYLILQWTFLLSDAYCQCVLAQCWEVWTSFYRNGLRRCLTLFWNPDYWLFWLYLHIFISNLTIFPVVVVNLIQHWRRLKKRQCECRREEGGVGFSEMSLSHTHIYCPSMQRYSLTL